MNWVLGLSAVTLCLAGCSADVADPTSASSGSGSTTPGVGGGGQGGEGQGGQSSADDVLAGPCPLGSTRECTVHNDLGCASGTQYCLDGTWSPCQRGENRSTRNRALTDDAVTCGEDGTTANVCDPDCQAIRPDEVPSFGDPDATIVDWVVGTVGDLPAGAIANGLLEPCNSDRDCEFDHHCSFITGQCIPFIPGQTNPLCATKYDISAGIPCDDKVIICNRGGIPVPAADLNDLMRIQWQDPPPWGMDGCAVVSVVEGSCEITATEDLESGDCMEVPCDVPADRVVFVDAGMGNSVECECGNNWTYNVDGECSEPLCGGDVAAAGELKLTMLIAMDNSGSMLDGSPTRLSTVKNAMRSFVQDAGSAGIGVAMRFWPGNTWSDQSGRCNNSSSVNGCDGIGPFEAQGSCARHPCDYWTTGTGAAATLGTGCNPYVTTMCGTGTFDRCCNLGSDGTKRWDEACAKEFDRISGGACSACNHPNVPKPSTGNSFPDGVDGFRFELTADAAPTDTAEATLVSAINGLATTSFGTPIYPSLQGSIDYCRRFQAAHPEERCVVVFATDGDPSGCNTNTTDIANLAGDGVDDGVLTYVVGIEGSNESFMNSIAAQGGTGAAFILGSGAAAETAFREALEDIRNTFGCSYAVPDDTDPALVTVEWNRDSGDTALAEVGDAADCTGAPQYYYTSSSELSLCPATCEAVRADDTSVVEMAIACAVPVVPVTVTAEFSAAGECVEPGTFPSWTLLLYNADVPTGSSIEVRARTKQFVSDAEYRDWHDVETITELNESSDLDDPTRLDVPLGVESFGEQIEIEFTTTVAGGAPAMHDYEVHFSCVDSE